MAITNLPLMLSWSENKSTVFLVLCCLLSFLFGVAPLWGETSIDFLFIILLCSGSVSFLVTATLDGGWGGGGVED